MAAWRPAFSSAATLRPRPGSVSASEIGAPPVSFGSGVAATEAMAVGCRADAGDFPEAGSEANRGFESDRACDLIDRRFAGLEQFLRPANAHLEQPLQRRRSGLLLEASR